MEKNEEQVRFVKGLLFAAKLSVDHAYEMVERDKKLQRSFDDTELMEMLELLSRFVS